MEGRFVPSSNVKYVHDFVSRAHLFHNCCALIIERQMRANMRIIEAVFESLFTDLQVINNALRQNAYGLSTRNYRAKTEGVGQATFTQTNPDVFLEASTSCARRTTSPTASYWLCTA